MSREKALAFIAISAIAIVFVLKTVRVLHSSGSPVQGSREKRPVDAIRITEPLPPVTQVAICIVTRRSESKRRHILRQTWLQDVPDGAHVSHIFVMGEDRSFSHEENAVLMTEVSTYKDILIAPEEEAAHTVSARTKHCIYWVTQHHDFDILIKADDDSTLFLSRLFGSKGWLRGVPRGELLYFGKRHALAKVPNPENFGPTEPVNTNTLFEFDYRGVYWPDHMEGGMYGISRGLAEKIVASDFATYASENAMVGVWVSAFRADTKYLAKEQVLSVERDYFASNGTCVVASFHTNVLHLASMWCEFASAGTLSPRSIVAMDVQQALDCLATFEKSSNAPRSQPLGSREKHQAATLASLKLEWPIRDPPDLAETGLWWTQMGGVFRGKSAAIVGTSTAVDRVPLYLLHGMHTLVMDDFFRVLERYTTWAPTMYLCIDPALCATGGSGGGGRRGSGRGVVANAESANSFARSVFAAFHILSGGVGGVEYWPFLRQRVNAHWFVAGVGDATKGGSDGAAGMGPVEGRGVEDKSSMNFRVSAQKSGIAMSVEMLSYLGFSPIYVTAANEELTTQWGEVSKAVRMTASTYGTEVVYLYADDEDKLPKDKVNPLAWPGGEKTTGGADKISAQQEITAWAKKRSHDQGEMSSRWDLEIFLQHFPVVSRLEIVRSASTVEGMFPRSMRCRDADDLDRFQKAVLCPVKISRKHFSSFLTWHVPYGPVRGTFVWVKR